MFDVKATRYLPVESTARRWTSWVVARTSTGARVVASKLNSLGSEKEIFPPKTTDPSGETATALGHEPIVMFEREVRVSGSISMIPSGERAAT